MCDSIARVISSSDVPIDEEDSSLPRVPRELIGNFYLALVAICHQTSPRGLLPLEGTIDEKFVKGWDYLVRKMELAVGEDPTLLTPSRLAAFGTADVRKIFWDSVFGERLTHPDRRAALLRDLGNVMMKNGWARIEDAGENSAWRYVTGAAGLLGTLSEFEAYRDPVAKKSVFFLALMRNSGVWRYLDGDRLAPPVDYHEVRGHLRMGTVRIVDTGLDSRMRNGLPVSGDEDIALRKAVSEAIFRISTVSGLRDPSRLHYLFWNVFRTICTRETPTCFGPSITALPARYQHWGITGASNQCPFAGHCKSAGATDPICDPVVDTEYY